MWALAGACPPQGLTLLPRSAPVFENSSRIVIVMEYASRGDLYDYLSGRQRLSEREARRFFRQIVSAVRHCHQVSRAGPGFPTGPAARQDHTGRWKQRRDVLLHSGVLASLASCLLAGVGRTCGLLHLYR